jgi:hypothetical protein
MSDDYRSNKKPKDKFIDKRLNPSYAQRRLGKLGVNDDMDKEIIKRLEKDNRYLQRKLRSVGITLGIVIRELEKNGYHFSFPGRKRENVTRDEMGGVTEIVERQESMSPQPQQEQSNFIEPEPYVDEDLPF